MAEDDGLIREVNEAVRQEKWQRLWQGISRYVITVSVLIILATISYVLWERSVNARYEETTANLYQAVKLVEDGKSYKAREAFEALSTNSDESLAMLAKMWLVKLKYQAGKPSEASDIAASFSKNEKIDKVYSEWIQLYEPTDLNTDTATITTAFRHTKLERQAIAHLKAKDDAKAAAIYHTLSNDSATPPSMRERSQFILSTYLADHPAKAITENLNETPDNTETNDATETE